MMDITLWHATKQSTPISGIQRYENQLEAGISHNVHAINRHDHTIRGQTFLSYFLDYRILGDIVHATSEYTAIPALLRTPDAFVVTAHGQIPLRYPELQEDLTTNLQWKLVGGALQKADRIIANSQFTKQELLSIYPKLSETQIDVVHLGVDLERFRPIELDKQYFGLGGDTHVILILSSTLPQKRMDIATTVVNDFADSDIQFVKAGYGEALNHPDIINTGWLSETELIKLYNAVDVLFHPSEYESFGLPLLEAMACNTPVIAQRQTAIPEVVGNGGRLVDGVDGFSECIRQYVDGEILFDDKPRKQAENFSWEKTIRKTEAIYEELS